MNLSNTEEIIIFYSKFSQRSLPIISAIDRFQLPIKKVCLDTIDARKAIKGSKFQIKGVPTIIYTNRNDMNVFEGEDAKNFVNTMIKNILQPQQPHNDESDSSSSESSSSEEEEEEEVKPKKKNNKKKVEPKKKTKRIKKTMPKKSSKKIQEEDEEEESTYKKAQRMQKEREIELELEEEEE
jgi:hypothetical protein